MLVTKPYDRNRAVMYAERWALGRNPLFSDFTGIGGDCTNFVSQAVFAGCCTMNFTPTFGWYYLSPTDRAPAWSGVDEFYDFICGQNDFSPATTRVGPYASETARDNVELGDVIQLADRNGDFYHTLIITGFENGEILISSHSYDSYMRRLSTYNYTTARFLHIEGIKIEVPEDTCFERLIEGKELVTGEGI